MRHTTLPRLALLLGLTLASSACLFQSAEARHPRLGRLPGPINANAGHQRALAGAAVTPWHGGHYFLQTGQPTALVVPPTVGQQGRFAWGVGQNTLVPVYHQFGSGVGMGGGGTGMFQATPIWPSSTDQFGVYPVRGPWN
jgi:hypothetical protein